MRPKSSVTTHKMTSATTLIDAIAGANWISDIKDSQAISGKKRIPRNKTINATNTSVAMVMRSFFSIQF